MDYKSVIQKDLEAGFSKSELERLIGLPQNNLASFLKDKRTLSRKSELKIEKWEKSIKPNPLDLPIKKLSEKNGRGNPFENAARGRDENGINNDEVDKPSFQKLVDKAKENEIPRLKGESSIDYRLRCIGLNESKLK